MCVITDELGSPRRITRATEPKIVRLHNKADPQHVYWPLDDIMCGSSF